MIKASKTWRRSPVATMGHVRRAGRSPDGPEIPVFFAPPFYKLDFSEIPMLFCSFYLGPVAGCWRSC